MVFMKLRKQRRLSVKQRDISDCGAACLASVCGYYGLHVAASRIRQIAGTDHKGTSVLGMVEAAIKLGFDAKGIRATIDSLELSIVPAIVHVLIDKRVNHYLVLERFSRNGVVMMDPADGRSKEISKDDLMNIWTGVAILMTPGESFRPNEKISRVHRISTLVKPYRRDLIAAAFCSAIVSVVGLTLSFYMKEVVDEIIPAKDILLLNVFSVLVIVFMVIQFLLNIVKSRLVLKTSLSINSALVMGYYRHVLQLPKTFFDSFRTGEIISRINDASKVSMFINELAVNITVDVLIILFSMVLMFIYNVQIALLVMAIVPAYTILYHLSNRINKKWQRRIMESEADLEAHLVESIGSASTIKYLGIEKYSASKTETRIGTLLGNIRNFSVQQLNVQVTADLSTKVFTLLLVWVGSYFIINGSLSTGELVSFYSLLACFSIPVLNLLHANTSFSEALTAADRLFEIMDLEKHESGSKKICHLRNKSFAIKFENVKFRYGNNDPVLKNVNFEIKSGTITGIKGKSGSGKSTLAALLLKSYEPLEGTVYINDIDLKELDRNCVTSLIAIAAQQPDLFSGTVTDNITIGRENDIDRLRIITERLGITQIAAEFSCGMDTYISENGKNLSGGQKQRVSIARALYRNAPILILDEATTAVDTESEEKIMQTIEWYKNCGNTVIIIAHSDSTLKICDNIAVLNDGILE
jgi:ATP-binding cassette subfamily B protein